MKLHSDLKGSRPVNRRSYLPFIAISAVLFIAGLGLGAGKSEADTSAANTASKFLLAIGLLALVITTVLELVSRRRAHRAVSGHAREVL
jgi:hypothetical protein